MLKKFSIAAAAVAVTAGLSFVGLSPAQAASSADTTRLCALNEAGEAAVDCSIQVTTADGYVREGETMTIEVTGAAGDYNLALFASLEENSYNSYPLTAVTVPDSGDGTGTVSIDLNAPVLGDLDPMLEGGVYHVSLADSDPINDDVVVGGEVQIHSRNAAIDVSGVEQGQEVYIPLQYGFQGDRFKVQILVDGDWVDATTVDQSDGLAEDGTGFITITAPEGLPEGQYEARLFNIIHDRASVEWYTFTLGDPVEESPSPSPSPSESGSESPSPSPTPSDDDGKPKLPKTGA